MGWLEILLLCLVALWLGAAVLRGIRRRRRGCSGCCADCCHHCGQQQK